jgi:hypothetical protein
VSLSRDHLSQHPGHRDPGSVIPDSLATLIAALSRVEAASNQCVVLHLALPLSFSVEGFAESTSISRSGVYEAIASGGLIARHPPNSRRTIITLFDALNWLATLPRVELSKKSEGAGRVTVDAHPRTPSGDPLYVSTNARPSGCTGKD